MTGKPKRMNDARTKLIAQVHMAKKDLGLSDDLYRDVLDEAFGVRSAAKLDELQLTSLVKRFRRMGWKGRDLAGKAKPTDPQTGKVWALWHELADLGELKAEGHEALGLALNAFVKRMVGVDHWRWLEGPKAGKVIEALKAWVERVQAKRAKEGAPPDAQR